MDERGVEFINAYTNINSRRSTFPLQFIQTGNSPIAEYVLVRVGTVPLLVGLDLRVDLGRLNGLGWAPWRIPNDSQ